MCSASFAFKTSFDQHCHFVHDRSTQMICKFCHSCYSNLKWHKLHYWKYYTCEVWSSQFPSQESLFQNLKTQNIVFSCRIYENWTNKCIIEITYNLHVHDKSPNPKSIQCTDKVSNAQIKKLHTKCGKRFTKKCGLKWHTLCIHHFIHWLHLPHYSLITGTPLYSLITGTNFIIFTDNTYIIYWLHKIFEI